MHSLLVPTDFSPLSRKVLDYTLNLFPADTFDYTLLHCNSNGKTNEILISIDDLVESNIEVKLAEEVAYIKQRFSSANVRGASEPLEVVSAINHCISNNHIDLVILGACQLVFQDIHGNNQGLKVVDMVRRINKSALLVPGQPSEEEPKNILFATRLNSIDGPQELDPLLSIGSRVGKHIDILNVGLENPLGRDIPSRLEEMINGYFNGLDFSMHAVQESDPYRAISTFSEERHSDMICLVFRKHGFIERLIRESVSERLINNLSKPLLLLKKTTTDQSHTGH